MSSNGRRPLFKKRSAPPPTATTVMLESMLNEKKKSRKKPKKNPHKQQHPCLKDVSNANQSPIILPTGGLEDAPTFVPKRMTPAILPVSRKAKKLDKMQGKNTRPEEKCIILSLQTKPKAMATTINVQKDQFQLALSIGRGKKRNRSSFSLLPTTTVHVSTPSLQQPSSLASDRSATETASPTAQFNEPELELSLKKDLGSFNAETLKRPNKKPACLGQPESHVSFRASESVIQESFLSNAEPLSTRRMEATKAPVPKRKVNNDNFVRLNMKNNAGACRGARNKSSRKHQRYSFRGDDKQRPARKNKSLQTGVDPLDDFMDGVYKATTKNNLSSSKASQCARHQRPCKLLVVKKNTSGNKGRKFYVCSLPRGEQCDHFEWADNTVEAAQRALARNSSFSGFVARQVAAYTERFQSLTVPELRNEAKRRNLPHTGKRKQLLMRLSIWVRDEVATVGGGQLEAETTVNEDPQGGPALESDDSESDDSSVSSEELEVCHSTVTDAETARTEKTQNDEIMDEGSEEDNESCEPMAVEPPNAKLPFPDAPSLSLQDQLQHLFGYKEFREGQVWAVKRCLEKKRTLLVAPTGFGKSLCYALPAALMDGICVVVSPLISLMQVRLFRLDVYFLIFEHDSKSRF